ncbi:MAG: fatty acid desaturase [Phycisphaerales bacterium]
MRLINLGAVVIPFAGLVAAMVLLWGVAFSWTHLAVFAVMYVLTGLGITVGFHRLFTHRSFDTPRPVAILLAVLGSMAVQGPLLEWVATHRRHHQHSDEDGDPHSPHIHGDTVVGLLRGLWHAHVGWMFQRGARDLARYVGDLRKDPAIRGTSRLFVFWVVLGLAIPAALGGLLTGTWMGVLIGFLWGGLIRVFIVHHVTWSINSVCHIWGSRPYDSHDESRNNVFFGWFGFGEGWHNNHHAFPNSARHGLRWWEFDFSFAVIRAMALIGLARNIRVPNAERMASRTA